MMTHQKQKQRQPNHKAKRGEQMPSKEQVDRVTERLYKQEKQSGHNVSREAVRAEVVKRAQRIDNRSK